MKLGIFFLMLGYGLSQFYRSFLAVLSPALAEDLGASAADLSYASGIWFLVFAAAQLPIGVALDRYGPRWISVILVAIGGGGGGVMMALAHTPEDITLAMAFLGLGGAPVLMAAYFIFARAYPAALFSTLAGVIIGVGCFGNLAGSAPLAFVVAQVGWRAAMGGVALMAIGVAVALAFALSNQNPTPKPVGQALGSAGLLSLFRNKQVLLILPMIIVNYAPNAAVRGLWAGPYLADVFGMDAQMIGNVTMGMALTMAVACFAFGPLERLIGSKKILILGANTIGVLACAVLWAWPDSAWQISALALAALGFFCSTYPVIMAHGQRLVPAHLTGRGITLFNFFCIGGVGFMQFATGKMAAMMPAVFLGTPDFYAMIFASFGLVLAVGTVIYAFALDPKTS